MARVPGWTAAAVMAVMAVITLLLSYAQLAMRSTGHLAEIAQVLAGLVAVIRTGSGH